MFRKVNAVQRALVRHIPSIHSVMFKTNIVSRVSEVDEPSRAHSCNLYLDDTLSAPCDYPEDPEEVILYPTSRARDTPSVMGLEGPWTTRVFEVFEGDRSTQSERGCHEYTIVNARKRPLEDSDFVSSKRSRN